MMARNLLIVLSFQIIAISLIAREQDLSSNIGQYFLDGQCLAQKRIFVNDTPKTLVLEWIVTIPNTDIAYSQNTILEPDCSYQLDTSKAIAYLKSKWDKAIKNYEISLSLGVVTKAPIRPNMDFESRALKRSESGLRIMKKDFFKHNIFRLGKSKNGKISYKAVSEGFKG